MTKPILTRRELIASAVAAGAVAAVPPAWAKDLYRGRVRVGPGRFLDGVASGEPSSRAITFWSRLTTNRPRSGARLVIATEPSMRKVVATTKVATGAAVDGALKTRVGGLRPSTEYFYVWESGSGVSPVGRTKTAPPPGSAQELHMTFSSCQQYAGGHYGAHAAAAQLPTLDAVMFLGDYIYERPDFGIREDPILSLDLASYRAKYALYRRDRGLRELHRLHPTLHIWDDHEIANNYSDNSPSPPPAQRAAGYRAASEWLPRMAIAGDRHRIYRRFGFGALADVFLLDERQYRTGDRDGLPRKLLGDRQMSWLLDGLRRSTATWKLIAQQVQVAPIPFEGRTNDDAWDGYEADRRLLLSTIESAGIENVVFLTGDVHVYIANLLASDFEALANTPSRKPAAVEYVGGSVTSSGRDAAESTARDVAPWCLQYNGARHGYASLDLFGDRLVTEYRAQPVFDPRPAITPFERFTQPAGENRVAREQLAPRSRRA